MCSGNIYLLWRRDIYNAELKAAFDMTGGGLSPAGHKSKVYPGYELTNSVRVLPQPSIIYVSVGGEPNSSVRIAELAELMISRDVCCIYERCKTCAVCFSIQLRVLAHRKHDSWLWILLILLVIHHIQYWYYPLFIYWHPSVSKTWYEGKLTLSLVLATA